MKARIRIFDPACGSGNFLVIAYKEMRKIEAEINRRRSESDIHSEIPLTNFRGIELRDFAAEIARLALIIAEYQCDVLYRGEKLALAEFLPLNKMNWIVRGNALRLDWLTICQPKGAGIKISATDLFSSPLEQAEIDFANEGGETYVCGNPPYQGSVNQTVEQKVDMEQVFSAELNTYKDLDYVSAFILKAVAFNKISQSTSAFVTTNSICQGEQVAMLWPLIYRHGNHIQFAYRSFLWSNLASNQAGVTCVIVGLSPSERPKKYLFEADQVREVNVIGPYLLPISEVIVFKRTEALHSLSKMDYGNKPTDGGNLLLSHSERRNLLSTNPEAEVLIRQYIGSQELIDSDHRYCIWIDDAKLNLAQSVEEIQTRINKVRQIRANSRGKQANNAARNAHRFVFSPHQDVISVAIPQHFSERREYITSGLLNGQTQIVANSASVIYGSTLVDLSVISSRLHLAWVAAVAGRIKSDYRYSNTLVWNTFPVPTLTTQNKTELNRCMEDILLAREAHFPATIADLYDPERMPDDLRRAHERNDETLERIYIGRRFKNDTERLEKLFAMYTEMTDAAAAASPATKAKKVNARR